MGMRVQVLSRDVVTLAFPLRENQNHYGTGFGGSITSAATAAAWLMATSLITTSDRLPTVLIRRSSVEFVAPVTGDFTATSRITEAARDSYVRAYERRGKSVVELAATVHVGEVVCAEFTGVFVALPVERP
jgi:thioesterase domain-containing protein